MKKDKDPLTRFYTNLLIGSAKLAAVGIFIALVVFAAFAGFALDFGSCFGKPSCSSSAGGYIFLFPLSVIGLGIFGLYKWRVYQQDRYREEVRQDVLQELGNPGMGQDLAPAQKILQCLDAHGLLSIEDLTQYTGLDRDDLTILLRELLAKQAVRQVFQDGSAYFTRSR